MRIQEAIAVMTAESDADNAHNQDIPGWHQEVLKERLNQLENHEEGLIDWSEAKKMLRSIADQCEAEPSNPHP